MLISDKFRDYELLDASGGERWERWGGYTLTRPDPTVIWGGRGRWNSDAVYRRSDTGGGAWIKKNIPLKWNVTYGDLTFAVAPTNFKHMGLFPEQAVNWDFLRETLDANDAVLNLFAYTGAASVAAAKTGARVTHVDAAAGMCARAKENAALSGLDAKAIRWIVEDCEAFVTREARRGKKYGAVLLDPPSYGRGTNGQVWKLEDNLYDLLLKIKDILENPKLVLLNSYTAGLSAGTTAQLLDVTLGDLFKTKAQAQELGLPITTGGVLPCGCTARLVQS